MTVRGLMRALVEAPNQDSNVFINDKNISNIDIKDNNIHITLENDSGNNEMNITKKYQALPEHIKKYITDTMEYFNFVKVQLYMESVNWRWAGEGIPSVQSLKSCARKMLIDACYTSYMSIDLADDTCTIETGGFFVRAWSKGNNVELRFNIETSSNF